MPLALCFSKIRLKTQPSFCAVNKIGIVSLCFCRRCVDRHMMKQFSSPKTFDDDIQQFHTALENVQSTNYFVYE